MRRPSPRALSVSALASLSAASVDSSQETPGLAESARMAWSRTVCASIDSSSARSFSRVATRTRSMASSSACMATAPSPISSRELDASSASSDPGARDGEARGERSRDFFSVKFGRPGRGGEGAGDAPDAWVSSADARDETMTRIARRSARSVNRRLIGPASSPRSPRRRGALQTARDETSAGQGAVGRD